MWQEPFIEAINRDFNDDPLLSALFLGGSFGRDEADAFSDADFVAVVAMEHHADFAAAWRRRVEAIIPIVFWYEARAGGPVYNAIGKGWERIDLLITDSEGVRHRSKQGTRVLIDHAGIYEKLPDTIDWTGPDKARVSFLIAEFIRVLGLLPVTLGRKEYLTVRAGLDMQRMALFQLLSEEVERFDKGGMLAWSRRLSPEQLVLLEQLPEANLTQQSLIDANLAVAAAFLPRARALAERWDIEWPTQFEAATWTHLQQSLNIQIPTSI